MPLALPPPGMPPDPVCTYDAIARHWDLDKHLVPTDELKANTPFFTTDGVTAVTTKVMARDAELVASMAGLDPKECGAKSWRIGGSEDLYDILGPDGATNVITERGRWKSDIAEIYRRCTATSHLEASARMGSARGVSLEALAEGWAMPGR